MAHPARPSRHHLPADRVGHGRLLLPRAALLLPHHLRLVHRHARVLEETAGAHGYAVGHDGVRSRGARAARVRGPPDKVLRNGQRHALLPPGGEVRQPGAVRHSGVRIHAAGGGRRVLHLRDAILPAGSDRHAGRRARVGHQHGADRGVQLHLPLGGDKAHGPREPPHRHHLRRLHDRQAVRVPVRELVRVVLLHRLHRRLPHHPGCRGRRCKRPVRCHHLHGTPVHQPGHHLRHQADTDQLPRHLPALRGLQAEGEEGDGRGRGPNVADACRAGLHADGLRRPGGGHKQLRRPVHTVRLPGAIRDGPALRRPLLPGQQLLQSETGTVEDAHVLPAPPPPRGTGHGQLDANLPAPIHSSSGHQRRPHLLHHGCAAL
mmetsp:Transcript_3129/g.7054  ORF Transcript_3129/g.7054 Transcript_3129/m.7054 type:complete len:376 (-) Transcript_3129:171-1298(-)